MAENILEVRLILASKSPRREKLLELIGIPFETISSNIDETTLSTALETVTHNSIIKAKSIHEKHKNRFILSADTAIDFKGKIIGKPGSIGEAKKFFSDFSGHTHSVVSAVTIINPQGEIYTLNETSKVFFKQLDDETINNYLTKVSPLDKAGGYGIQEYGWMLVEKVEGSIDNVMGLPLSKVFQLLSLARFDIRE
jgi:septum formation protein